MARLEIEQGEKTVFGARVNLTLYPQGLVELHLPEFLAIMAFNQYVRGGQSVYIRRALILKDGVSMSLCKFLAREVFSALKR